MLKSIKKLSEEVVFDAIIHLAAESHVDRSIDNPLAFTLISLIIISIIYQSIL